MNYMNAPIVMSFSDRELLTYRVMSGVARVKTHGKTIKVLPPSLEVYLESCELYNDKLHEYYSKGVKDEEETVALLIERDLWSWHDENDLKKVPKRIDDIKLTAYESRADKRMVNRCKNDIASITKEFEDLLSKKAAHTKFTCEALARTDKMHYIIRNSSFCDGRPYIFDSDNIDFIVNEYNKFHDISDAELRYIARSQPWVTIWSTKKKTQQYFFSYPDLEMTINQKTLVTYSQMYDSVYESMDKPSKDVIEDDILLDGWFIKQHRKREIEESQNELDQNIKSEKIKNSSEVYSVVGNNDKKRASVENLNNPYAKMIKKERESVIRSRSKQGPVSQAAFKDEQIKLNAQRNDMYKGKFKNGQ